MAISSHREAAMETKTHRIFLQVQADARFSTEYIVGYVRQVLERHIKGTKIITEISSCEKLLE